MFHNKKGEEKIISIYWFIILLLVATGIIIMVNIFYGSPYDVRLMEAEILSEKVANCIDKGGKFNSDLFSETGVFKEEFRDNFMDHCNLNFKTQYDFEEMEYYLEINITQKRSPKKNLFEIKEGNPNFKTDCDLDNKKHQKLVQCFQKEFFTQEKGIIYSIKIISMVRKSDQNVK
jgi:hypothetical protein